MEDFSKAVYKCNVSNLWSDECSGGHNFIPELYSILEALST